MSVSINAVVIGPKASGKTQILRCLSGDIFDAEYQSTTSPLLGCSTIKKDDDPLRIQWMEIPSDPGINHFSVNAEVILLCLDLTDSKFFDTFKEYFELFSKSKMTKKKLYIIGTKNDGHKESTVTLESIEWFFKNIGIKETKIILTSAKANENIEDVKNIIANDWIESEKLRQEHEEKLKKVMDDNPIIRQILLEQKLTINILSTILDSRDLSNKLLLLETAFYWIQKTPELQNKPRTSLFFSLNNETYSDRQLSDIALLKKTYIELIKPLSHNQNIEDFETIREKANTSQLIDFQQTRYKFLKKEKTRSREIVEKIFSTNEANISITR